MSGPVRSIFTLDTWWRTSARSPRASGIAHHGGEPALDRGAARAGLLVLEIEHAVSCEAARERLEIAAVARVVVAADHVADLLARDRLARVHAAPGASAAKRRAQRAGGERSREVASR